MNIEISEWKGRLGNRIWALRNAIHVALILKTNIILPADDTGFISTRFIQLTDSSSNKIIYSKSFFEGNFETILKTIPEYKSKNIYTLEINKKISDILKKYVAIPIPDKTLDKNDLVIHMRSGDIMVPNCNLPKEYTPPPLIFYINIIANHAWKNIYIVCEDNKHPCMKELIIKIPRIKWKKQSLKDDIKLILSAQNLIIGGGSFIPTLLFFPNNIKNIIIPHWGPTGLKLIFPNIQFYTYCFPLYVKKIGNKWKCIPEQIYYMLNWGFARERREGWNFLN